MNFKMDIMNTRGNNRNQQIILSHSRIAKHSLVLLPLVEKITIFKNACCMHEGKETKRKLLSVQNCETHPGFCQAPCFKTNSIFVVFSILLV